VLDEATEGEKKRREKKEACGISLSTLTIAASRRERKGGREDRGCAKVAEKGGRKGGRGKRGGTPSPKRFGANLLFFI